MRFSVRSRLGLALSFMAVLALCLTLLFSTRSGANAASSPLIKTSVMSGPPTTALTVTGKNFGLSESVNIDFDTTLVGTATTDGTGAFSASVKVPRAALPGSHTFKAVGQTSKLSATVPFTVQTQWITFGFDQHRAHYNPYENIITHSNVSALVQDWLYTTGGAVSSSDGKLYALNAATGALLWSATTGGAITSSPIFDSGMIFVGSADGKLYAFNKAGTQVWTFTTSGAITASPLAAAGVVYVGSTDGNLYAITESTGAAVWSAPFATGGPINSSATISAGILYVGSNDGKLYAITASTGAAYWTTPFATGGP